MLTLTYQLDSFSSAHRLVKGYQGKCAHLHGHNYRAQATFVANTLDEHDLMIDFNIIKKVCNAWIGETLDHGTLVCSEDKELLEFLIANKQKHYVFANGANTSLEQLAHEMKTGLSTLLAKHPKFGDRVKLASLKVWETDKACIEIG